MALTPADFVGNPSAVGKPIAPHLSDSENQSDLAKLKVLKVLKVVRKKGMHAK